MNIKWHGALLISLVTLAAAAQQQQAANPNTGSLPPGGVSPGQQPGNPNNLPPDGVPPGLRRVPQNVLGLNRQQVPPPGLTNNPAMLPAYRFGRRQYVTNGAPQLPTNAVTMGTNPAPVMGTNPVAVIGTNPVPVMGTNPIAIWSNTAPGVSSASALASNRFGSAAIAPMSPLASTNRIYVTNAYSLVPRAPSSVVMQDQASTVADQKLLVNLRTRIPVVVSAGAAAGVHLIAKDGTVTLIGSIPTERESQRIVEMIQRTPGVTQVINQLQPTSGEAAGATTDTGSVGTLVPNVSSVSNIVPTGNLVPTGATNGNGPIYPGEAHTFPPRLQTPPRTLNPPASAPGVEQTAPNR